ncbi:hypothetical protein GCM10027047_21470 [Rhodococcus aerolatus]
MSTPGDRAAGDPATTDEPAATPVTTRTATPAPSTGRPGRRSVVTAAVALVVALVLLGGAVTGLVLATHASRTQSVGEQRDDALDAARTIAGTLTTVNGADVTGTLDSWDAVVAGPLADEFKNSRAQIEQRATQTQASVTSTVTGAALTQLDTTAGTAAALVFVDTSTSNGAAAPSVSAAPSAAPSSSAVPGSSDPSAAPGSADPSAAPDARTQRLALTMSLTKQDGRWRAIDLQPVAQGGGQ